MVAKTKDIKIDEETKPTVDENGAEIIYADPANAEPASDEEEGN